jgi:hypothetical protein
MDKAVSHNTQDENHTDKFSIKNAANKAMDIISDHKPEAAVAATLTAVALGVGAKIMTESTNAKPASPEVQVEVWSPTVVWNGGEIFPAGTVLENNKLKAVEEIPKGSVGFVQRPQIVSDPNNPTSYARVKFGDKFFLIDLSVHRDGYKAYAYKSSSPDVNHKLSWRIPARNNGFSDVRGKVQVQDSTIPKDKIAAITFIHDDPDTINHATDEAGLVPTEHGYPY